MMQQNAFAADFRLRCNRPNCQKAMPWRAGLYWASSARTGTPPVSLKEPVAIRAICRSRHFVCRRVADDQPPLPIRHCCRRERRRLHRPSLRRRFPGGEGARAACLTRLVLATQDRERWEALPAADTNGLTAVFVGTGRQLLAEMFMRLPEEEQ
ncbi:hypothetical protein niasHS_000836 [Heterodera schachtii]|uniref:Uncharacterized protein n=1 Tax=Heterodera schachtii TaxID=97005 RepID=A0ABD2KM71_HETSC